jgi:GNAT superfamily N-acetyltransferase
MIREIPVGETALGFLAMRAMRTHLESEAAFVEQVDTVLRPEGYRLAGAFEEGRDHAVAALGFRVLHMLAWGGRGFYIDDLVTHPEARRRGHARALLDWAVEEAGRLGCRQIHLDSATIPDRVDAHRLYFNAGMGVVAFHFMRTA